MKRKSILLLICLLLIACLTFTACNNNTDDDNNSGDTNTWPSISYITDAEKYTGAGEITHTTSFADDSNGIYINNATSASVSAYRTQMENAGWTLTVGPVDREDSTAWGYTKGESTCTIRLYNTVQTEERSSGNYSFNLYISFANDGAILPPSGGDGENPGGESNPTGVSLSDFNYQLGNNYYISSRWDVTYYDNYDNEYVYQEYRRIALIGGVYYIETYDFNYEMSNTQGNFAQVFYIPNGSDYQLYSRFDASEDFELASSSTTNNEFSNALSIALGETSITKAKTRVTADTIQYVTAGSTSTHATGKTVKKYTYGTSGTPIYEFYVDTQTKACLKYVDHLNAGTIDLSIFSTSGNAWGSNGLPARPDGVTEPTALSAPIVSISGSGLASWAAVPNATGYKIIINGGAEEFAVGLSEQLTNGDTIQVKAVGDGETYSDSAWSAVQTYTEQGGETQPTTLATPIVTINGTGLATWAAITNASGYKYKIDGGAEQTAPANRQVQLTDGQSITVKAAGNGTTYADSGYSASETYTEVAVTSTWPTSAKLAEYGFGSLTQPTGSTISLVGETEATEDEPATLTIVISNGTGQMFDNLTTALYNLDATYAMGFDGPLATENKSELIVSDTNSSSFVGLKSTAVTDVYDGVMIEYYISAGTDDGGNPIAAQTFIISFAKINASSSSTSSFADYVTLPNKFTLTFSYVEGETRTIIKDGDKLWYHVYSADEDKESLAIKQLDNTYITYEKDNKQGAGSWGTDPEVDTITYSDDVYSALAGFESSLLSYAQCKVNGDTFQTGASTTVANMTCNVYTKESYGYTDTYYTYNGLTFKYTEAYEQGEPRVGFVVLTYSATGDLSGSAYSID